MKTFPVILFLFLIASLKAQEKSQIYLLPGQGSDCRIFSKLEFDTSRFEVYCLEYGLPSANESMREFAVRISREIDTSKQVILIGVSLGGMLCTEIAHTIHPEKTIIISSAASASELPKTYRIQKNLRIHEFIPGWLYKRGALFLQPLVEPDRKKEKATFKSMLKRKSPLYFKRTVKLIVLWDREENSEQIIHIHGDKDHTLPIENTVPDHVIKDGSHMMTLTKGEELSELINSILKGVNQ
ncbi:MAG: alpha/beta hydrolase [Brumimicrobium sp.]|nr:alpha/beta hydrolase [Brumimicrobium sp.]